MVIGDGAPVEAPTAEVVAGDLMLVRSGAKIAVDGVVEDGEPEVVNSTATGESLPVHKPPGSAVVGATINANGTSRVRATKVGSGTAPAEIVKPAQEAQNSKVPRTAPRAGSCSSPSSAVASRWRQPGHRRTDRGTVHERARGRHRPQRPDPRLPLGTWCRREEKAGRQEPVVAPNSTTASAPAYHFLRALAPPLNERSCSASAGSSILMFFRWHAVRVAPGVHGMGLIAMFPRECSDPASRRRPGRGSGAAARG
ncbi:hypothetical protein GCM10022267_87970 [Lentzea roselyniae]|uniref:P-type ATPase A domain-containing protein n=1 Tax=Lentzea roselyniae TaxID=531940 RepID=A0ABP7CCT8_9PSEU